MKISKLIKVLQEEMESKGDLTVTVNRYYDFQFSYPVSEYGTVLNINDHSTDHFQKYIFENKDKSRTELNDYQQSLIDLSKKYMDS